MKGPPISLRIKQVYEIVYDFGFPNVEEKLEVYEIVRCAKCDTGACDEEADLHEQARPLVGLYMPCLIHGDCGALLTTDREPARVYHFDDASFKADEEGHRHADAYPLYPIHNPQTIEEFRVQSAPFRSPLMSVRDLLELASTGIDYIWDKYLAPGLITFLISDSEMGKTTFILSLIDHILQGRPFVGLDTQPAKIIYISEEPAKLLASKVLKQKGSSLVDSPFVHLFLKGVTKVLKPGKDGKPELQPHTWETISGVIRDEIHKHHRTPSSKRKVLIVLDTLMGVVSPKDILDPSRSTELMNDLRMLTTTTDASLLVLHHTTKEGSVYLGGTELKGLCDFMLKLTYRTVKRQDGKFVALEDSPLRLVKRIKHRDEGALVKDFWVEFDVEGGTGYHLPEKPPPVPGEKKRAAVEESVDLSNPLGLSSLQQRLLALYQAGETSPTKLGKALGCDKSNASRAIAELKKKKAIE